MANNVTDLIKVEMAKLKKQYDALEQALRVLQGGSSSASAKTKTSGEAKVKPTTKTGKKRGRKPGKKAENAGAKVVVPVAKVSKKKKSKAVAKPAAETSVKSAAKPNVSASPAAPAKAVGRPKGKKKREAKRANRGINLPSAIVEYITKANRFVVNSELSKEFHSFYPEKSEKDFSKYISVILSIAKSGKKINATDKDRNGETGKANYWGLPTWFDGGNPKAEFYK
ncbi:MAG: hypothetical protein ACKVOR_01410 [Flavobacteriales bacterium]